MSGGVSVVIPTYNRREMVCEAVESALAQTRPAEEVLVVDNGSADGTAEALRRFGGRVRVLSLDKPGLSAARNAGMEAARGEFLAFLDNDDIWAPDKLERQLPLLEDASTVLAYSDAVFFRGAASGGRYFDLHRPARGDARGALFDDMFAHPSTMVFRRAAGLRAGPFDARYDIAEEYDFLFRLAALGKFDYVDAPLVRVRVHPGNESRARRARMWEEVLELCQAALRRDPGLAPRLGDRREARLCEVRMSLGFEYLRAARPLAAASSLVRALAMGPGVFARGFSRTASAAARWRRNRRRLREAGLA